ncbi:MAG TPA: ROK family transcriptional regulator [Spirochaetia bacterium]
MHRPISEVNIARVLQKLWYSNGISRVDIARELRLGKSTVTNIVARLLERNLVKLVTGGKSGPAGGRRPTHLVINDGYGCVLGVEIQTDSFTAVATNLLGEVVFSHSEQMEFSGSIVSSFAKVMRVLDYRMEGLSLPLIGIGVGIAGIIDPYAGAIVQSNPLDIHERVDLEAQIATTRNVPVLIENDAKCCCWGELAFRKRERHTNFMFVLGEFRKGRTSDPGYWGVAVGFAFVLNGRVYHGEDFSAGEFQSILWEEGNQGQFSVHDDESRRVKEDPAVRSRIFTELSAHIAFLVNTLNLTSVVIGGEIASYRQDLAATLQREIQRNWSYENEVRCSIEFAAFGDRAVAYGAAGMFLERFFSVPDVVETPERSAARKIGALYAQRSPQ